MSSLFAYHFNERKDDSDFDIDLYLNSNLNNNEPLLTRSEMSNLSNVSQKN
ncbi:hypothetical protein ACFFWB_26925 [Flavobacterium procerum]|uniref:hypothetical protein n=1 Tax=Flavobacterium procerum TaxID=1455569 RepID=UPI0035EBD9FA